MRPVTALILAAANAFAFETVAAQTLYSCPDAGTSGDLVSRGIYVSNYPGLTLDTVTLAYTGNPGGTYTVTLTPRVNGYDGLIVGAPQTQTVTVNFPATTPVTFSFGNAPVPFGSTITFTQTLVSGPGSLYFDTGVGPCANVTETVATTPQFDSFRRSSAGLAITGSLSPLTSSIDQSDLYYIVAESGWGMQLVHRGSTIFATLFVYAQSTQPTWYVATMRTVGGGVWTGDLYATTGPWFGTVPFNPANVVATKVGTMTWTAGFDGGTVAYTVSGVAVSKNVVRETTVLNDYSGHFFGALHQTGTGCANPVFNATTDTPAVFNIVQDNNAVTLTALPAAGGSCTFNGTLQQDGQMGAILGSYTCSTGFAGQFEILEFQVTEVSVKGIFNALASTPAGCSFSGWLGGLTVTTF